jgi:hypothetical protein
MTLTTRRDARQKPRVGKETAMRPLARFVLALSIGLASEILLAQDPATQSGEPAAPVPAPIVADGAAAPETTLTAPADEMPAADVAPEAPESGAALAPANPTAQTPTPGPAVLGGRIEDHVEPPPPPPPHVEVAGSVEDAELGPSGRKSDWFFLAVLAVAVAVIATKLLRTRSERVSIHEERRLGGLS